MTGQWRKIEVPGPEEELGYMLIPPDESRARGPFWEDEEFVERLAYCLNIVDTMEDCGLSVPVPEPEEFDILFTPARKPRAKPPIKRAPRRKPL